VVRSKVSSPQPDEARREKSVRHENENRPGSLPGKHTALSLATVISQEVCDHIYPVPVVTEFGGRPAGADCRHSRRCDLSGVSGPSSPRE